MRTEGRQPVRRAHSEMETSASGGPGVGGSPGSGVRTGQPPSHPVSLEAISSQPPPPGAIPRRYIYNRIVQKHINMLFNA